MVKTSLGIVTRNKNAHINMMAGISAFLITLFILISPNAFAQDQNTLILDNDQSIYNLAPFSYITINDEKKLTADELVKQHKNNLKGEKTSSNTIRVKDTKKSMNILFTVENKTKMDHWILHFGNTLDGRMGMIKKINILNYNTKQSMSFPRPNDEANIDAISDDISPFLGSAISLKLMPDTKNIIILEIEAQEGLPLIFMPKLIAQDNYIRILLEGNIKNVIAAILFFSIISFFLASFYIARNKASKALISYYLVLSALFFNFDAYIVPISIVNGSILFWLYITSFTMLVMAGKFFSKMRYDQKPIENIALIMLTIFMVVSAFLHIFIFGGSITGLIVMTSVISVCLILLAIITFFTSEKPAYIVSIFCLALILPAATLALITLIMTDYVDISYLPYFWYIHIVQALLFVTAYLQSNVYRKQRKIHESDYLMRDEQALYQLKKSKDSADKTRLLRVIERERELMSELREREIKRTEEMRVAKDTADRANQAKSAFLAVVSHEIRTPMNGILGMVQLLQSTSLSKSQSDYVDIIRKSGDSMMTLLNDILDFEKIERGSMEVETVNFDIHKLVQDIVILMSGHASQKNIELNTSVDENVPKIVSGDPTRLRQVILNLINNGLKFTEKGEVRINIKLSDNNDNKIRFEIKDTGIGISKEAQKKLFTPFTQAETSTSRKYGGTGLGLAISLKLIEAMGGTIKVDSEEGQGSTFYFDLEMNPLNTDNVHADEDGFFNPDEQQPQYKTKPMRILVTEDNEMNRKVLEGLLTQQGHTLFMASNGLECLDICKREQPDLILMDIQMDGLSGVETTKKLRANTDENIASIPVIALTGNVMLEDIEEYFSNGMNGFIAKPIDSKQLEEILYNASLGKFENDISKSNPLPKEQNIVQEQDPSPEAIKQEIDLKEIKTDLSLDDREHYVSDSEIKISTQTDITKKASPSMDIQIQETNNDKKEPSISVSNTPNTKKEKPTFNRNAPDDEMTEIQRYLMQQHSSYQDEEDTNITEEITEEINENIESPPPADNIEETPILFQGKISQADSTPIANTAPTSNIDVNDLLDTDMLQNLIDTLGEEQFKNLLQGFLDKATEIIDGIRIIIEENNIAALGARAHELKGMAGNFGMKYVSELATNIEKAAKTSQTDDAINDAQKLSAANDQTQAALKKWVAEQQNSST